MTFYERFKELSNKMGTTPTTVVKALGIGTGSLSAWKNGSMPSAENIRRLSDFFNVSTDYLLLGKEPTVYSTSDVETEIFEAIHLLVDPDLRRLILRLEGRLPSEIRKVNQFLDMIGVGKDG